MGRYRGRGLVVIHRIKHIVDKSATITATAVLPEVLINTKDAPVLANTTEVETGAKVHGIFINVQIQANQSINAIPNIYMAIYKSPGGNIPAIDPAQTGSNADKKQIIHQEMNFVETTSNTANPRTLFKGVVVIPRGMQRFGADDELIMSLKSNAINFSYCVQCIFKEFR